MAIKKFRFRPEGFNDYSDILHPETSADVVLLEDKAGNFSSNNVEGALAELAKGIPRGIIVMWSGSVDEIPEGWALCDGTNGTPDLRDRFIVGAGNEYAVGDTGGEKEVTLSSSQIPSHRHGSGTLSTGSAGSHSHSGSTSSAGAHNHTYTQTTGTVGSVDAFERGSGRDLDYSTASTSTSGSHTHSLSISSAGSHSHSVTGYTDYTGSGEAHENRPPYYALAFIMKL